ncbi:MAG TPA: DUF1697 domain-containing protein [Acidimicrobiia bacterium]
MTTRVALLRGINLAGKKRVPMADLRELATKVGLTDPKTYVQSGNLIFDTDLDEAVTVAALEEALNARFGFDMPVVSRSADEIREIAAHHPFSQLGLDHRLLQVAFLDRPPKQPVGDLFEADEYEPDRFQGDGREVYLAYPNGSARSKLGHALLERRLGVSVTLRNWRTVTRLAEMASSRTG